MLRLIKNNLINVALIALMILMLLTAFLTFVNRSILDYNDAVRGQVEAVKREFMYHIDQTLRHMDVGLRGYAINQDPRYLYVKPDELRKLYEQNQFRLDSLLKLQNYTDAEGLQNLKDLRHFMVGYFTYFNGMVEDLQKGKIENFKQQFKLDKGSGHGTFFTKAQKSLYAFENDVFIQADDRYRAAITRNGYLQIVILLMGLPTLWLVINKLRKEEQEKKTLISELDNNNRQYLFYSGKQTEINDSKQIVEGSIRNFQHAADFVSKLSEGDYEVRWVEMNEENQHLNTQNLAGKLIKLKEGLKRTQRESEIRNWANEGLTTFSTIVRNTQHNLPDLSLETVRFLTKHLNAQQGSLFLLKEENEGEPFLELAACYAFERKKYLEKRIAIGNGLVGQAYQEGEAIVLTEIPPGYIHITSGLGEATPGCLAIVPLKYNAHTQAVIELASFYRFDANQLNFLEKAGEFVASAIANARISEKMKALLEQSQQQEEEMRAQEEEMRQNLEEMNATQEEIQRKEKTYIKKIKELEALLISNNVTISQE